MSGGARRDEVRISILVKLYDGKSDANHLIALEIVKGAHPPCKQQAHNEGQKEDAGWHQNLDLAVVWLQ
jgi:hypothetical protein